MLSLLLFESILIPLVWVGLTAVMVKGGTVKDAMVLGLVLIPVSVMLCISLRFFVPVIITAAAGLRGRHRVYSFKFAVLGCVTLAGGWAWSFLATRFVREVRKLRRSG